MTAQSKASMRRSKPSYFMAILGVALVLFILGMLGWLVINASKLETYFKGSVQVHAFVRDGSPQKEIDIVNRRLKPVPMPAMLPSSPRKWQGKISSEMAMRIGTKYWITTPFLQALTFF